jgi:hypothetical protein
MTPIRADKIGTAQTSTSARIGVIRGEIPFGCGFAAALSGDDWLDKPIGWESRSPHNAECHDYNAYH